MQLNLYANSWLYQMQMHISELKINYQNLAILYDIVDAVEVVSVVVVVVVAAAEVVSVISCSDYFYVLLLWTL